VIARSGTSLPLIHALMLAAAEDPDIQADHTTLLCPCGTKLDQPWEMTREDFLAHVIFNRDFEPERFQAVGDRDLIQKAMLAHHAAKKTKIARKYRAKYGANTLASLADNLGDLGVYCNEGAYHKGHQVAGISAALRFLTPIDVRRPERALRVEGLTDFRVTRASQREEDRFQIQQFPAFFRYGRWMRHIIEETFSHAVVLPRMADAALLAAPQQTEASLIHAARG